MITDFYILEKQLFKYFYYNRNLEILKRMEYEGKAISFDPGLASKLLYDVLIGG